MSDHIRATIDELQAEIRPMEEKIIKTKQLINMLCDRAAMPPLYPDAELSFKDAPTASHGDEFFNRPLNTCLKQVLVRRKTANRGPATAEEIYDAMIAGGYQKFPSSRDDALTGLRISLGKSTHTFVRLPNGAYGLCEWYGTTKKVVKQAAASEKQEEPKSANDPANLENEMFTQEEMGETDTSEIKQ